MPQHKTNRQVFSSTSVAGGRWSQPVSSTEILFDRGYTGHTSPERSRREMLDEFGIIDMPAPGSEADAGNGRIRVYPVWRSNNGNPVIARFLSPDPFIQAPSNTQNFNRYSYVLNNPLVYTDPSGEWMHLVVGAIFGGTVNWISNGAEFSWEGLGYFGIGAAAGAIGAGVGVGIQTSIAGGSFLAGFVGSSQGISTILSAGYSSSFINGSISGSGAVFAGGFSIGLGNGLMQGQTFSKSAWSATKTAIWSGLSGAVSGGIAGGIDAELNNRNFWTGGAKAIVYRSPVSDNFGSQNGECALRCLEEFSESYGMEQYDYWFDKNGSKLGVRQGELEGIIDNKGVFSSDRIMSDPNSIAKALSNDQRVLMGFNTDNGGAHAVMVRKVKIWPSGRYRIWFAETSPEPIAPFSTSNIFNLGGAGFWTFYPL